MPKYEIGPKVLALGLAVVLACVILAAVALGAKDVALRVIDAISAAGMEVPAS